jgi:ATP-binding cassette subfamily F protein 3
MNLLAGDRIGLLGVNGAGKSTLVKALSTGSTLLDSERHLAKDTKIGYFAQHQLELLDPESSPIDHLRQSAPDDREQDHRNYLGRFGFGGERIFEPVAPFSGGEKARLVLALMIRQGPNLLLLDEPTNHLDLEMRQALSVALIEYTGALVVISHDRHLLRSVCDELFIVHDRKVERFKLSLDDYPAWLREQDELSEPDLQKWDASAPKKINRKQQRQAQAEERRRLKPLQDAVRKIEKDLESNNKRLAELEVRLADETIYADTGRKDELTQIIRDQADVKSAIEALEWEWLQASEELEQAR